MVEWVWLLQRLTLTARSGENLNLLVGVASNIGDFSLVGVVLFDGRGLVLVGVASGELDFLFRVGGVVLRGEGCWEPGCFRGDRRVGVACDVGMVTRTTLSGGGEDEEVDWGGV